MNHIDLIDQQAALLNALHDGQSIEQALQAAPAAGDKTQTADTSQETGTD